jgi:hypothetical protein
MPESKDKLFTAQLPALQADLQLQLIDKEE